MKSDAKEAPAVIAGSAALFLLPAVLRSLAGKLPLFGESSYALLSSYALPPGLLTKTILTQFSQYWAATVLGVFSGIVAMFCFWLLMRRQGIGPRNRLIVVAFALLTPALLHTFGTLQPYTLSIPLVLILLLLLLERSSTLLIFFVSVLISVEHGTIALFVLALAAMLAVARHITLTSFTTIIAGTALGLFTRPPFFLPSSTFSTMFFAELGTPFGIGVMILALALLAFPEAWERKKQFGFALAGIATLLFVPLFGVLSIIFAAFGIGMLAGRGFATLWRRSWHFSALRPFVLLIVICGIIFSTLVFIADARAQPPQSAWRQEVDLPNTRMLVDPLFPRTMEALFDRPAVLSENRADYRLLRQLQETTNPYVARQLLLEENVSILILTPPFAAQLPWADAATLRSNEIFKNVHSDPELGIWEVR